MSLDATDAEGRFQLEPVDRLTPDQVFERRWGLTVMERAMERLRRESETEGGPARFDALKPHLTGAEPQQRYREVADRLGASETAVKAAVHRLRQRYGRLLRDEIAQTLASAEQVDDELRYLLTVVRPWHAPPA